MAEDWFLEKHTPHVGITMEVAERLFSEESPYQRVEVVRTREFGRMLVLDGAVMLTERDEFIYHEMLVHPPLLLHERPERVLIVGGGDGGTIRETLRHGAVRSITLVEIDALVVETCRRFFPELTAGMDDPRVEVVIGDGFAFLDRHRGDFDVILVDCTDPVPLVPGGKVSPADKLFTPRFFEKLKAALRPGGLTVFQSENPFLSAEVVRGMHADLRKTFRTVRLYLANIPTYPGGLWSFTFASDEVDPAHFRADVEAPFLRELKYFHPALFPAALTLPVYVQKLLTP